MSTTTQAQKDKISVEARKSGYGDDYSDALNRYLDEEMGLGPQAKAKKFRAFTAAEASELIDFLLGWMPEEDDEDDALIAEAKALLARVSGDRPEVQAALEALA